LYYLSSPWTEP